MYERRNVFIGFIVSGNYIPQMWRMNPTTTPDIICIRISEKLLFFLSVGGFFFFQELRAIAIWGLYVAFGCRSPANINIMPVKSKYDGFMLKTGEFSIICIVPR